MVSSYHGSGISTVFGLSISCTMTRRHFFKGVTEFAPMVAGAKSLIVPIGAAASDSQDKSPNRDSVTSMQATTGRGSNNVAYKTVTLNVPNYGVRIPVACWFPAATATQSSAFLPNPKYQHRISVRRIGELLAGWDFIPEFASKTFEFSPTLSSGFLVNGERFSMPLASKVVILSHGFLGSRFDLSHIAEDLAGKGFVCFSPEYPESLAASYQRVPGLDRNIVNNALLEYIETTAKPSAYGVVGHSLGCGTALRLGDASWTRVLIAGPPAPEDCPSPVLLITSTNDVFVRSSGRPIVLPPVYHRLQEGNLPSTIPRTSALVFDRPNGPNHISYLSENVNDAMVNFLSPLLPLAQALSIPVLDFDTYQASRDAKPTAAIIRPLISSFMVQQMTSSIELR